MSKIRTTREGPGTGPTGSVIGKIPGDPAGGWDPIGKWDSRYKAAARDNPEGRKYGRIASYRLAALFLEDCTEVEDWGCGFGTFRQFCLSPTYIGIEGSESPATDRRVDLRKYGSNVEGILLRHVLEHNLAGWREILLNAIRSFSRKMVLVIYTPFGDTTRNIRKRIPVDVHVPDAVSFRKEDIMSCIPPEVSWFTMIGEPLAEHETMFFLRKNVDRPRNYASIQDVSYCPDFDGDL